MQMNLSGLSHPLKMSNVVIDETSDRNSFETWQASPENTSYLEFASRETLHLINI